MLAYVFWHWPRPGVATDTYTASLAAFHAALAASRPSSFHSSVVFRIEGAPWVDRKQTLLYTNASAYEEWYLLEDSGGLDSINGAAVSSACREAHERVARQAAGGVAGLYRLRLGQADLRAARRATWFAKPAGTTYDQFYAMLEPVTRQVGGACWGRQMVLGPAPEFCLLTPGTVDLPAPLAGITIGLEPIWGGG